MRKLICAGVLAGLLAGCGESAAPEPAVPAELVGEWTANPACAPTCAFTLTWKENPSVKLDALQLLGEVRMDIGASGRFAFGRPGEMPPAGVVRVVGQQLVVTDVDGTVDTIDYQLQGSVLRLDFRREWSEIDFDNDGDADASTAAGLFVRR